MPRTCRNRAVRDAHLCRAASAVRDVTIERRGSSARGDVSPSDVALDVNRGARSIRSIRALESARGGDTVGGWLGAARATAIYLSARLLFTPRVRMARARARAPRRTRDARWTRSLALSLPPSRMINMAVVLCDDYQREFVWPSVAPSDCE